MAVIEEKKRKELMSIRLNPRLHEYLQDKADSLRMTKSAYIEYILMSFMVQDEEKKSNVR